MPISNIDPDALDRAVDLYLSGAPVKSVSQIVNISNVYRELAKRGIDPRRDYKILKKRNARLPRHYAAGLSLDEIAEIENITAVRVGVILKDMGVTPRHRGWRDYETRQAARQYIDDYKNRMAARSQTMAA